MSDNEHIFQLIRPILAQHPIRRAELFGSYATGEATASSDVDILVEFTEPISLLSFVGIKLELEDALKRKVDLVEYHTLKPALSERILAEAIPIYG
jgi:uncharacterized protein